MTRARCSLVVALVAAACLAVAAQQPNFDKVEVHLLKAQGNVYMLVGAGGNVTVQVGRDGVLLVDTEYAPMSNKILAAVRTVSQGPLRYIVNTHSHPDHVGGNENLKKAGSTIAGGNVTLDIGDAAQGAQIISHINAYRHMSARVNGQFATPAAAWPTSTFLGDDKKLYFNDEGIDIIHQPAAHTDGDSIVFFRKSDVISAGDIFVTNGFPFVDLNAGGNIQGIVAGLNRIVDMCIPVYGQEGGTMVIPGHGRLSNVGDVINYREMVTIVRDRVQDLVKKNMTLEQVKAARPTQGYDALYNTPGAFVTADAFVEAVYRSLKK
ncbi:MAG TPA: MBL fold metallo-hydrolase [Vicinamibacterales bacterium]|nr:MBL fold metallo-hydrolase [Vicinamibacterales bacterium]